MDLNKTPLNSNRGLKSSQSNRSDVINIYINLNFIIYYSQANFIRFSKENYLKIMNYLVS